jgi:type III secretory pathway component EscR
MKTLSPELLLIASVVIAAIPLMIAVGTCYLKFSIVLSLLKSGFGTQQAPSASLVMALSLVMSLVVMQPVVTDSLERLSTVPVTELSAATFGKAAQYGQSIAQPWKVFLLSHSVDRELTIFTRLTMRTVGAVAEPLEGPLVIDRSQVCLAAALAAFVLSEIKKGFTLAFFLLIPFFVIDLVVANLLVALGLTMMSPIIVSLPLKILLFISTDGWLLLARNMIQAYR